MKCRRFVAEWSLGPWAQVKLYIRINYIQYFLIKGTCPASQKSKKKMPKLTNHTSNMPLPSLITHNLYYLYYMNYIVEQTSLPHPIEVSAYRTWNESYEQSTTWERLLKRTLKVRSEIPMEYICFIKLKESLNLESRSRGYERRTRWSNTNLETFWISGMLHQKGYKINKMYVQRT